MRRRTRLMCHCEEQSDVAISGRHLRLVQAIADRTHLVGGGVLDAPPAPLGPRNDKLGSKCGRRGQTEICSCLTR